MRNGILLIGVAIVCAVMLLACGPSAPDEGRVIDKSYDDPDEWTTYHQQCYSRNKEGICTMSMPVAVHHEDGEHFHLQLEIDEVNKEGKTKTRSGWREVPESIWHECEIGDYCSAVDGRIPR